MRHEIFQAAELRDKGLSWRQIRSATGVDRNTVLRNTNAEYRDLVNAQARARREQSDSQCQSKQDRHYTIGNFERGDNVITKKIAVVTDRTLFPTYHIVSLPRLKWLEGPPVWERAEWNNA